MCNYLNQHHGDNFDWSRYNTFTTHTPTHTHTQTYLIDIIVLMICFTALYALLFNLICRSPGGLDPNPCHPRVQGTTPSWDTGPGFDHTYNDTFGHFAYIETSYPRIPSDKAILTSAWIKTENPVSGLDFRQTSSSGACRFSYNSSCGCLVNW